MLDELVVGCAAMVPKQWAGATVAEFELAKMAVRPDIQGQGFGQQLLERCIQYAKEQGASRVVLTTNDILTPALKVYHKAGFVDLPSNPDTRYARGQFGNGVGAGTRLTPGADAKVQFRSAFVSGSCGLFFHIPL
ncbi:MAG: hypothetical protein CM15mP120_26990 [Pseudomonadota bacterium]|nr:MAG: hypothetical protein CM15mP120_26990 [Pseudomonadota bacterium]